MVETPQRSWPQADPAVQELARYLRLRRQGTPAAARQFPTLAAAEEFEQHAEVAHRLQLMVVAGVGRAEIAGRLGLDVQVVQAYEAAFFDVRPLLNAHDWIVCHVLRPVELRGDYQLAARFRSALAGQRAVLEALLADDVEFPIDGNEPLFRWRVRMQALEQQALDMAPFTPATAMDFVKLGAKALMESRRLEFEEKKFSEKCLSAARDYELKRQRLEIRRLDAEARVWKQKARAAAVEAKVKSKSKSASSSPDTSSRAAAQESGPAPGAVRSTA